MAQGRASLVVDDLIISQGSDNAYGYVWSRDGSPVPLETDGWVLTAQIRKQPGATPWLTLTSVGEDENGSVITVNDAGEIVVYIDHVTTEDPAWNSRSREEGVWDLEAFHPATGEKRRVVMGAVTVSHDVTRIEEAK